MLGRWTPPQRRSTTRPLSAIALGDALCTQRSVRRLKPDRVRMEVLRLVLEAAIRAPSGGNFQPARFLLLTDRQLIQSVGVLYREAWWAKRRDSTGWRTIDDIPEADKVARGAARLADDMVAVPAVVIAFGHGRTPGALDALSVIPAVQNLMLAARALGLGSVPTTLHPVVMERLYELLGVPDTARFNLLIPLGFPESPNACGPTTRRPTAQTCFIDRWGGPSRNANTPTIAAMTKVITPSPLVPLTVNGPTVALGRNDPTAATAVLTRPTVRDRRASGAELGGDSCGSSGLASPSMAILPLRAVSTPIEDNASRVPTRPVPPVPVGESNGRLRNFGEMEVEGSVFGQIDPWTNAETTASKRSDCPQITVTERPSYISPIRMALLPC